MPSGHVFTVHHHGHCEGTIAGLPFGTPNRDDPFSENDFSQLVRDHWGEFNQAQWSVRVQATDTLVGGLEGLLKEALKAALEKVGAEAATAVVSLIP